MPETIVTVADGTKMSRQEYIARICEMDGSGKPFREIVAWSGRTGPAVHKVLAKARREFYPHLAEHIRDLKMQQHNALMHIYREAMQAWHKSCARDHTVSRVTKEDSPVPGSSKEKMSRTVREGHGNPAYLNAAMQALNQIAELWPGMKARQEIDLGLSVEVVHRMSLEERRELAESMARMSQAELLLLDNSNGHGATALTVAPVNGDGSGKDGDGEGARCHE